jgi:hypothetical protein
MRWNEIDRRLTVHDAGNFGQDGVRLDGRGRDGEVRHHLAGADRRVGRLAAVDFEV